MQRFRFRLSALLWLVAILAAMLWGIRYRQDRQARPKISIFRRRKGIHLRLAARIRCQREVGGL